MSRLNASYKSEPVVFRGASYRAEKGFWHGTQRIIPPEETLERIRPFFPRLGLTRLANITGLDRIGIHTVLSVRPNSSHLSVDAGKGFTLTAATVSAAMECFERQAAEYTRPQEFQCSYVEVGGRYDCIPLERLPLAKNSLFHPRLPERWTLVWNLLTQTEVAVPTQMVTMARHRLPFSDPCSFHPNSNGLAAGNHFLESLSSGLLELIERDAVTCRRFAWERGGVPIPRVRLESIEHPETLDLLARFARAGVLVVLFDCTVDTGVPVYMAYIYDRAPSRVGIYRGYGAHPEPGVAMVRAMTEAVQGRLVFIAGSRDDTFRYHRRLKQTEEEMLIRALEAQGPTVDACARASEATTSFEGDVHLLLRKLTRGGFDQVLVFDLSVPEFGVSVVRVIVPGLEGYMFDNYLPGPRARAFLEGQTQ